MLSIVKLRDTTRKLSKTGNCSPFNTMADQNMEKIAEERVVEEPFTMVKGKKSQKRKLDDSVSELLAMDTSEPEKKRPLLPPTSCEKIGVRLLLMYCLPLFVLLLLLLLL